MVCGQPETRNRIFLAELAKRFQLQLIEVLSAKSSYDFRYLKAIFTPAGRSKQDYRLIISDKGDDEVGRPYPPLWLPLDFSLPPNWQTYFYCVDKTTREKILSGLINFVEGYLTPWFSIPRQYWVLDDPVQIPLTEYDHVADNIKIIFNENCELAYSYYEVDSDTYTLKPYTITSHFASKLPQGAISGAFRLLMLDKLRNKGLHLLAFQIVGADIERAIWSVLYPKCFPLVIHYSEALGEGYQQDRTLHFSRHGSLHGMSWAEKERYADLLVAEVMRHHDAPKPSDEMRLITSKEMDAACDRAALWGALGGVSLWGIVASSALAAKIIGLPAALMFAAGPAVAMGVAMVLSIVAIACLFQAGEAIWDLNERRGKSMTVLHPNVGTFLMHKKRADVPLQPPPADKVLAK